MLALVFQVGFHTPEIKKIHVIGQYDCIAGLKGPAVNLSSHTDIIMKAFILLALFAVACKYED